MTAVDTTPDGHSTDDASFRPLAALAFWCCLFLSGILFAALALAPRLKTYRELEREYATVQHELTTAERRVDELQKVADALEHDPEFAAEQARIDFDIVGPEERIPVGRQLSLGGMPADQAAAKEVLQPFPQNLLNTPFLDTLCDDASVRQPLLGTAAFLIVVAFTLLCRTRTSDDSDNVGFGARCGRWLADRYGKA